ncbi:MAG: heat-inducible transcription repressor HrcA [Clostridia bacterium]|nr:MAG: heat-inducible transcription repressor HrcA [Clostridia bacterium]
MRLDERKRKILQAIVEDYVATAEPVGSRTVARKYNLGISPATIRNEMADLEEIGFLEQPHTSAGRIPSDFGYRYYVDEIMNKIGISQWEEAAIRRRLQARMDAIELLAHQTTEILSEVTRLASVVMGPIWVKNSFEYIRLLPVDREKVLLLVVTTMGLVEHFLMEAPAGVTAADLDHISRIINRQLKGLRPGDLTRATLDSIYDDLAAYRRVVDNIMDIVFAIMKEDQGRRVYLGGTLNILEQPEFRDVNKLKDILSLLSAEDKMWGLLAAGCEAEGLTIRIGHENKGAGINNCSIITATYQVNGEVVGTLGIIGPTRMEYARVASMVEYVSKVFSEVLSRR